MRTIEVPAAVVALGVSPAGGLFEYTRLILPLARADALAREQVVLAGAGEADSVRAARAVVVAFSRREWWNEALLDRAGPPVALSIPSAGLLRLVAERAVRAGAMAAAEGFAMFLASECTGTMAAAAPLPSWLHAVSTAIDRSCAEPFDCGALSRRIGIHPATLASRFRRATGMTVGDAVRMRRVERARERIESGDEPLAAIARAAGFYDESHLSRCFRRITGMTPGAYRVFVRAR